MATAARVPIDHPGTFILEELEGRGWAQADLAYVLGWDASQLNRLIKGQTDITPDSAMSLGDAFDMPAEFFLNLQKLYDLQKARRADPGVRTRAAWLSVFPVREMINRGWIEDTEPALLDLQMMRFFDKNRVEDIPFANDVPVIPYAAKKSGYEHITAIQYVWLHRVKRVAEQVEAPLYSEDALRIALPTIRAHMMDKDDFGKIPEILHRCGVRFVIVAALPGSKIDGVCLWLDGQPVIGMTLRLDRTDNFCFVLRHEIEHVLRGDGKEETFAPVDEAPSSSDDEAPSPPTDKPECEVLADAASAEFCVPQDLLTSFILRKSPYISEQDVLAFAARVQVHPGVVVGQIQNKTKRFGWLRKYQTGVRSSLLEWKYKDGWGFRAPTGL